MFNIEQYLKRFSRNISSIENNKEKILEIINKHTGLKLEASKIEIKDYKIIVFTSSVGKSQIFIKKNNILEEIKSSTSEKVVDIK